MNQLDGICEQAAKANLDHQGFLMDRLIRARHENRLERMPQTPILDEMGYRRSPGKKPACSSGCWFDATSAAV